MGCLWWLQIPTLIFLGVGVCVMLTYSPWQRSTYVHVTAHVLQTLPPLAVGVQHPATIDPTLDLCTRYPLQLGGQRQCGIQSLPDTYTWPALGIEPQTFWSLVQHLIHLDTCSHGNNVMSSAQKDIMDNMCTPQHHRLNTFTITPVFPSKIFIWFYAV